MLAALTGLLLGCWHVVTGPDHLAAVAPLATATDERKHAAKIGGAWGLGHASGVWLVGLVLLAFGSLIPLDLVGAWSERIVGLAVLAVGVWGLVRATGQGRHDHDGHAHHGAPLRGVPSALSVGVVHGVAGSSHLYGVLPALALGAGERLSYLLGFGLGSILAMSVFAGALAALVSRVPQSRERIRRGVLLAASVIAVVIGLVWIGLAL